MSVAAILLPLFVQVGLTFALMIWMARRRFGAIGRKEVKTRDVDLRQPAWPPEVLKVANAFHNQLELPLLFYVLVALALFTKQADFLFVVMSWMFVASRLVHAAIYTTGNDLRQRFFAFLVGALLLMIMWIIFAIRILTLGLRSGGWA